MAYKTPLPLLRLLAASLLTSLFSTSVLATESVSSSDNWNNSNASHDSFLTYLEWAGGLSTNWAVRRDYGEGFYHRYFPEMVAYAYAPFTSGFFWRGGARLGYEWLQPEMPSSVRIEEKDTSLSAELGLVYEFYLIPSLSLGAGYKLRKLSLVTEAPIVQAENKISKYEFLPFGTVQLGLGLPVMQGFFLIEPFARWLVVQRDARAFMTYGIETTFSFQ